MKKFLILIIILLASGCSLLNKSAEDNPAVDNDGEEITNVEADWSLDTGEREPNSLSGLDRSCAVAADCRTRRVNCGDCSYEFACVNSKVESCSHDPAEMKDCPAVPAPWFTNCQCQNSACVECREDNCEGPF
jgi:hypothetical protein